MSDDRAQSPSGPEGAPPAGDHEQQVWWATWVGVGLSSVGVVCGVTMALKRRLVDCPDGTIFEEGATDFTCYVHPQAWLGTSIAALSIVLAILLVFTGILVRAALRDAT